MVCLVNRPQKFESSTIWDLGLSYYNDTCRAMNCEESLRPIMTQIATRIGVDAQSTMITGVSDDKNEETIPAEIERMEVDVM